MRSETENVV